MAPPSRRCVRGKNARATEVFRTHSEQTNVHLENAMSNEAHDKTRRRFLTDSGKLALAAGAATAREIKTTAGQRLMPKLLQEGLHS